MIPNNAESAVDSVQLLAINYMLLHIGGIPGLSRLPMDSAMTIPFFRVTDSPSDRDSFVVCWLVEVTEVR